MSDDIIIKTAPDQQLIAIERPIPGFGPDNTLPVLIPALRELAGCVSQMGVQARRPYLSCFEVRNNGEDVTMFVGTSLPEGVTHVPPPTQIVLLPGVEVATCVRQGATRDVWPQIVVDTMRWIEEHGYEHVGPGRDYFLELHGVDSDQNVFEIQVPVRRPEDPVPLVAPQRVS